ncbi:MAG TPA: tryptophan synthase subunit alpha [Solibacterales bacterium]|nr:tryptophan synthase subunit alpha [Bryobacterales bacterium]
MNRIAATFDRLRAERRTGLVAYLTAGDPTPGRTPSLVAALERGGADLIELGVPFSDPIADGPVIQRGSERALAAGTTLPAVLEMAARIRLHSQIPIVLFTYLNPVMRYGFAALAKDAAAAGVDGCLLTDLSVEEAEGYVDTMHRAGLDTVFLAAPTSAPKRRELVARYSTGFLYLVSRTGVTGVSDQLSGSALPLIESMRALTDKPLAVGFGISRAQHAAQLAGKADAIVVGSAFVRIVEQHPGPELESRLEALAAELSGALKGAGA